MTRSVFGGWQGVTLQAEERWDPSLPVAQLSKSEEGCAAAGIPAQSGNCPYVHQRLHRRGV